MLLGCDCTIVLVLVGLLHRWVCLVPHIKMENKIDFRKIKMMILSKYFLMIIKIKNNENNLK